VFPGSGNEANRINHAVENPPLIPRARNPFPFWRISTFMALIAAIGLGFGLYRASPGACDWLLVLIVLAAPSAILARNRLADLPDRGESIRLEDRIALFLSVALFTVPIQLYISSQFISYGDGWEPGPVCRTIYRWWLTISK
jgi:hypothetical protein